LYRRAILTRFCGEPGSIFVPFLVECVEVFTDEFVVSERFVKAASLARMKSDKA
jgi:hypothetical protein